MVDVRHFETGGRDHFQEWFVALDNKAALEVSKAVYRLELGNFSNLKSLGGGLWERKIDWGPGYRIYLTKEGDKLVILYGGGDKSTQGKDIKSARAFHFQYLAEKKESAKTVTSKLESQDKDRRKNRKPKER